MNEAEDEFAFTEEKRRVKPRVIVPIDSGSAFGTTVNTNQLPPYLKEYIIDQTKIQPVATKLDSILIKGSKILKLHPKSNYIESSFFLMAKAFFYKSEWLPAEIKCSELIDKYPLGEYSPDAHLLYAKCYLIERKYILGKNMLSRTVDIAWQMKRYDILSEAFRLMAEHALFEANVEEALRPYRQAIAQCDDNDVRGKWQLEIGSILYRISRFEQAEKEFTSAKDFSLDVLGEFEADLLRASCLIQLGKFDKAEPILAELERNQNYKEWQQNVLAERMRMYRLQSKEKELATAEKEAEKVAGSPALTTMFFERGMEYYRENNYLQARQYFARAKSVKSPVSESAGEYYNLLNRLEELQSMSVKGRELIAANPDDSLRIFWAKNSFDIGRTFEKLLHPDSTLKYFQTAVDSCPNSSKEKARFLYGVARLIAPTKPEEADSLMEIIALTYPTTDFGVEARQKLGFTNAIVIDTVMDIFQSGSRFRAIGDDQSAIRQFVKLADKYRTSPLAPRSLYAAGWIFERRLEKKDSALYYYKLLLERYPNSVYAKDIFPSVNYYAAYQINGKNPDSVPPWQQTGKQIPDSSLMIDPPKNTDQQIETSPRTRQQVKVKDGAISIPSFDGQKPPVDTKIDVSKLKVSLPFGLENYVPELPFVKSDTTKKDTNQVKKP
jgi:tetratricopeptide (TPR) repeat protein